MNLEKLISLFQNTHAEMKRKAAKSVNTYLVVRNWLFGFYIVEFEQKGDDRAEYGKKLIETLSEKLKQKEIKGVSMTNLKQFRQFFETYRQISQTLPDQSENDTNRISQALPDQLSKASVLEDLINNLSGKFLLSWTHYISLLSIKNDNERKFYEIEALANGWGYRELQRQINSALFERIALSKNKEKVKELSEKGQVIENPQDIIKDPYILEFLNLPEHKHYSEHELETAIIDKLEQFLLELGKGFLFEARQKRFTFDDDHFYVDLVFYNRLLKCFVVIDLKIGNLKHQDLGQMQMYVNYFDRCVKTKEENPTIGILLCHKKSNSLVELTLPKDSNIYASKYQLYLPTKEELKKQIDEAEKEFNNNRNN